MTAIIALYGRSLNWVLDRQPLTLAVAVLTLAVTVLLYVMIPKGFFPVQDTGMIQGISEASQSISYQAMAGLQNKVAEAILKDPDVAGLSSFIGVDGINQTQNTGRFLINLKPHDERRLTATQIIRRIQHEISGIVGITLYMQPVQDLTIDATMSRAPYHFVLEDANPAEFNTWVPRLVDRLNRLPQITDVASDLQQQGLALDIVIDRATAARFGITPATVDNALYDAFGQRIISTIYTQSNQYRVILEVDPTLQSSLDGLSMIYLPSSSSTTNGQVPLSAIVHVEQRTGPLLITHYGQLPATTISFNTAPGVSLGEAVDAIEQHGARSRPADQLHHRLPGHRSGLPVVVAQRSFPDHGRGRCDVHRARRSLRELHPPDHHSVDPAVGRRRRAAVADAAALRPRHHRHHRHHSADRHRQEKRDHDDRLRARSRARTRACRRARRSIRPACCASARS